MRYISILIILILFGLKVKSQLIIDNGIFFSDSEKLELTDKLQRLKNKSTVETLVYTTMDLGGKTPLEYGKELSNKYPAGVKGVNNGIIILLSKNDKKVQVLVGNGLEWVLSDSVTKLIINEMMVPHFKNGKFYNGVNDAVDLIIKKVTSINWIPYKLKGLSSKENGNIFKFQYSNKTGKTKYKYAIDTDPQFSDQFKIKLNIDGKDFDLFYSKYMNELISKILKKSNVVVYFRLSDFNNKRLELMGIE